MSFAPLHQAYSEFPWLRHGIRGKQSHPRKQKLFLAALRQWSRGFIQLSLLVPSSKSAGKLPRHYAFVFSVKDAYTHKELFIPHHDLYGSCTTVTDMYRIDERKALYSWTQQLNAVEFEANDLDIVCEIESHFVERFGVFDPKTIQSWFGTTKIETRIWSNTEYTLPIHPRIIPSLVYYDFSVDDALSYMQELYPYQKHKCIFDLPDEYKVHIQAHHFSQIFANSTFHLHAHILDDLAYFHQDRKNNGGDSSYLADVSEIIIRELITQHQIALSPRISDLIIDAWSYLDPHVKKDLQHHLDLDSYSRLYSIVEGARLEDDWNVPQHPMRGNIRDAYGWVHLIEMSDRYFDSISRIYHRSDPEEIHAMYMDLSEQKYDRVALYVFECWHGFNPMQLSALLQRFEHLAAVPNNAMPTVPILKNWLIKALPQELLTLVDGPVLDTFFGTLRSVEHFTTPKNQADHLYNLSSVRQYIDLIAQKRDNDACDYDISVIL